MLTRIFRALTSHLAKFGVPLYLADCVPSGTKFPYLTLDIQPPASAQEEGLLTLTYWCTGDLANTQRLTQMDALSSLLPPRGLWLSMTGGAIVLRPLDQVKCVTEATAQGVQEKWKLLCFPSA